MVSRHAFALAACGLSLGVSFGQIRTRSRVPIINQPPAAIQKTPVTAAHKADLLNLVSNAALPPITLMAATAISNGKSEVRLRWLFTEGWIPDGRGFNVYKIVGGTKTGPLNPTPLNADERKFQPVLNRLSRLGSPTAGASQYTLLKAFQTAKQAVPGDRKTAFSFSPRSTVAVNPAGPSFSALKLRISQLSSKSEPGVPMSHALQTAFESSELRPYADKLGVSIESRTLRLQKEFPGSASISKGVQRAGSPALQVGGATMRGLQNRAPTLGALSTGGGAPVMHTMMATSFRSDPIRDARAALVVGTLTLPNVADAMGLSFTDTGVANGQPIQYVLDFVPATGAPMDIATTALTVGADPQPPTPEGLDGTQVGVNKVWLYWKPPTPDVVDKLVLPSYRVFRVDGTNPSGVEISGNPVLKSTQPSLDNPSEQVEPLFSFEDGEAPVGSVTYKVFTQDAFGRLSAEPATVAVNVQDWETPKPVGEVKAKANDAGAPVVYWEDSATPGSTYRIYRYDLDRQAKEQANYRPDVAADMIEGEATLVASGRSMNGLLAMQGGKLTPYMNKLPKTSQKASSKFDRSVLGKPFKSFTDAAAPKDKYYRYLVTAVFTRNKRDSEGHLSGSVGAPYLTPPPAPQGLTGTFELLPKRFFRAIRRNGRLFNATPNDSIQMTPTLRPVGGGPIERIHLYRSAESAAQLKRAPILQRTGGLNAKTNSLHAFANIPKVEYACNAALAWQPIVGPGAPFTYKVYRYPVEQGDFTRFIKQSSEIFKQSTSLKLLLGAQGASKSIDTQKHVLSQSAPKVGVTTNKLSRLPLSKSTVGSAVARQFAEKVGSTPAAIAQTSATSVKDGFTASPVGQDVDYLVVPVNQWGVEGPGAKVRVHLKPTLAPTVPTLIEAMANDAQPDQGKLSVLPNPEGEEVTKYIVLRKSLPAPEKKSPPSKFLRRTLTKVSGPATSSSTLNRFSARSMPGAGQQSSQGAAKFSVSNSSLALAGVFEAMSTYLPVPDGSVDVKTDGTMVQIIDKSTKPNSYYAYRVIAVNSTNMQSGESGFLEVATRLGSLPAPTLGTPAFNKNGVAVPVTSPIMGSLILERAQTVDGTDTEFIQIGSSSSASPLVDRTVIAGQTYKYRVRMFSDSIASPPSAVVTVVYTP